ncbi:GH10544 [Drosophila grimshawi]|uniref:GH10544 n=1 Tax=Drosophila grimshawi TaxID=7222 RepID=B4JDJ3_DROGR|nr:GH10544 [Drosophila grimshawi]
MVHQNRTSSKAIASKHLSPMRNTELQLGKYAVSSSPADSFLRNTRLTVNTAGAGNSSQNSAYKYNNMVDNNREKFNALHFC